jgi:hypothetical protein
MSTRTTVLGSRRTIARFLTQIPLNGDVPTIAASHETNRQSVIKTIFVHLFLMSKYQIIPGPLTIGAAKSQYLSAAGDRQAAHCAPGQLLSNNVPLQRLTNLNEYLEITLDCLFGVTDDIHSNFNKADSSAEENGLLDAFCNAANRVVQNGRFGRFERAHQFLHYIETAFGQYKMAGQAAFDTAIVRQRVNIQGAVGNDIALRNERILILQTYKKTLSTASNSVDTVQGLDAEEIWQEVRG